MKIFLHAQQSDYFTELPLISVIIPCYNQAHYLAEAIESALGQTYKNIEIIVVDDGSTDNTAEVAARYPNLRYIRQENQGLSAARNRGIRESKADLLSFLDADDRLLSNAIEVGIRCLKANSECAFASGNSRLITSDGAPLPQKPKKQIENDHYIALLQGNYIGMPATVLFRRINLESVGGFDTSLQAGEDYDLYLRIAQQFPIVCHDILVAEYRRHDQNMSNDSARMLISILTALRKQRRNIKGNTCHESAYKIGIRHWQHCYGVSLSREVLAHLEAHLWKKAFWGSLVMLRYAPTVFFQTCKHLPRHILQWIGLR